MSGTCNNRMVPTADQNRIPVTCLDGLTRCILVRIEILKSETVRPRDPVIIDLIQVHLVRRVVSVMLVRRVARPVPARRLDLKRDQLVCRKRRRQHINNLSRNVSASP